MLFPCLPFFFSKSTFLKNSFRVSNSLDQIRLDIFVEPDLGPNCLQRLNSNALAFVMRCLIR